MTATRGPFEPHGLTVAYTVLGAISIDEFIHAFIVDMYVLRDVYNVRYVAPERVKLRATDEFGEEIKVRRPGGGYVHYLRTHHYRPACKDYEL
jgi:hypothetical protein